MDWLSQQRLRLRVLAHQDSSGPALFREDQHQRRETTTAVQTLSPVGGESSDASATLTRAQVVSSELPQRVRIAPFDLLLVPTPMKFQRSDEDLLIVDLQDLVILFMKTQFGHGGSVTNGMGDDTTLEYVLFSDIDENSWAQHGWNGADDPPRTVLRFNGGVASFVGPDIPSEEKVNEWVEAAVNGLFTASLAETPYNYVELTRYMMVSIPDAEGAAGTSSLTVATELPLRPAQTAEESEKQTPLFFVLISLTLSFSVIAPVLALWVRHNNQAVRILCLSSKENEEIVDFTIGSPISISHESGKPKLNKTPVQQSDDENEEDGLSTVPRKDSVMSVEKSFAGDLHHNFSIAAECANDEASLQSSTSEFTVPALSFRNPNPFGKGLVSQESFQKERKTYLSKDMLYPSWTGRAPNLNAVNGRRKDDSVLQPSYFSAAKEWMHLSRVPAVADFRAPASGDIQRFKVTDCPSPHVFLFEAAHEDSSDDDVPDRLDTVASARSRNSTSVGLALSVRRPAGPKEESFL